jgi:hypothetical protein
MLPREYCSVKTVYQVDTSVYFRISPTCSMKKRSRIVEVTAICIASFAFSAEARGFHHVAHRDLASLSGPDATALSQPRIAWGGFGASAAGHGGVAG